MNEIELDSEIGRENVRIKKLEERKMGMARKREKWYL